MPPQMVEEVRFVLEAILAVLSTRQGPCSLHPCASCERERQFVKDLTREGLQLLAGEPMHTRGEILTHFRCQTCQGWWTIADAPSDRAYWLCPWCGGEFRRSAQAPARPGYGEEASW